jgi:hypothetical protein
LSDDTKKPSKVIKRISPNYIPLESFKAETRPLDSEALDPKLLVLMKQFQKRGIQVVDIEFSKIEKQDYLQEAEEESEILESKVVVKPVTRAEFLRRLKKE